MSYVNDKKKCFIAAHDANDVNFKQQCDGRTVTYFEDFTHNHNKILIYFEAVALSVNGGGVCADTFSSQGPSSPLPPVTVTVIIDTRDGKTFERTVPFVNFLPFLSGGVATFQAEDVCRVSLRCDSGGSGTTILCGFFDFVKTFCICCHED